MNQSLFFNHVPPQIRQQKLDAFKGYQVIRMPYAYATRIQQSPLWEVVVSCDSEGMTVKAAPNFLIEKAIKTMEKYQQDYQLGILE